MPTDKKKIKKDAKTAAKNKRGGARRVKAAAKVSKAADRSAGRASVAKRQRAGTKAEIRTDTRRQTAANLERTGKEQMKTGKKTTKVKSQVVTPKSAHKKKYEENKGKAAGMSKKWRKELPARGKKKR